MLLGLIREKLEIGTYPFKPARCVLIPKAGTSKKRKLGIPVVMDCIVSQSLHTVLEEILELLTLHCQIPKGTKAIVLQKVELYLIRQVWRNDRDYLC